MRTPSHAIFAVLAAILTMVAVFAVKRGTEWALQGASGATLDIVLAVIAALICAGWLWTYSWRPRLVERRQKREDARLR